MFVQKLYEEEKLIQDFFIPKIISSEIKVKIGNTGLGVGEIPDPVQGTYDQIPIQR